MPGSLLEFHVRCQHIEDLSNVYKRKQQAAAKHGLGGCAFLDLDTPLLMETDPIDGGYTYEGPLLQPWHGPGLDLDIPSFQAATSDHL